MARCASCNGIIAKTDLECYVCGDSIPGRRRPSKFSFWRWLTKPSKPSNKDIISRVR